MTCQVAAPAGHHMWTRPEQLQPAEGPHHAQHHDQPGPANTAGTQRMPHLLRAGSAGSLLSVPAQCGLRRWVETHKQRGFSTLWKLLKASLWESLLMFWFIRWRLQVPLRCCSNPVLNFNNLSIYVVFVQTECAHRMKKCIKCQVTITKKIRQGKRKNIWHLFLWDQ